MRTPPPVAIVVTLLLGSLTGPCLADPNVVVSAFANPDYTKAKYGGETPRAETYVVMQGQFFEGGMVDNSIDRMPFRRILDFFAPELARRQYWPARNSTEADLLIVVHWGTTTHQVSTDEMRGRVSAVTDMRESAALVSKALNQGLSGATDNAGMSFLLNASDPVARQLQQDNLDLDAEQARADLNRASNAQLLGYTRELRKLSTTLGISTMETTLKSDLSSDRYFVILKAYDLHEKIGPGKSRKAAWTLHLNMRSPGTNFQAALDRMSVSAVDYFGRATDGIDTVRPHERTGKVEIGMPVVVMGEKK